MIGKEYDSANAWTRAHHECIRQGDPRRAARAAFWQACGLLFRGDMAPAMGWIARGRRTLEGCPQNCPEQAWLMGLTGLPIMFHGDPAGAMPYFVQACEMAERFDDPDVVTFGRLTLGTALVVLGETAKGLSLLDETMVAVTSGEVSPIVAGIAYCQVIDVCQEIFDLRRAREWTAALSLWCDSQPDLVPYRGNCLIHRCEILQLQGAWPAALEAAQTACDWLAGPAGGSDMLGSAHYQLAEIHRLRGEFSKAEESYRRSSQSGRDPEPGMSLLRLALGNVDIAASAIRRVAVEAQNGPAYPRILPAFVEIMLAANDVAGARAAASELSEIAAGLNAPALHASSAQATGAVLIAEGDARAALDLLRGALKGWQAIEVPYECARARVLIANACRALGDEDSAAMELDAARRLFEQLGAAPELGQLDKLSSVEAPAAASGLTAREAEVLSLLATGKSNREIASTLTISEHTVARHVQNIFAKLGVTSRTAASAFAFEHGLL